MKASPIQAVILAMVCLSVPACHLHNEEKEEEPHEIIATSPMVKDVVLTQQYVCQIHSGRHINIRALLSGYLEAIHIKEGQAVKAGDILFRVLPTLYEANLAAEKAEVQLLEREYNNTVKLFEDKIVANQDVLLHKAKLDKAKAKLARAKAEVEFTKVKAPFDGIIDRLHEQQGSLVKEGDTLTTLSDNSVMWVYFNVPEAQLSRLHGQPVDQTKEDPKIELMLAGDRKHLPAGSARSGRSRAKFNNETGQHPLPRRLPESEAPAASRSDRHRAAQQDPRRTPSSSPSGRPSKSSPSGTSTSSARTTRRISARSTVQNEIDDVFVIVKNGVGVGRKNRPRRDAPDPRRRGGRVRVPVLPRIASWRISEESGRNSSRLAIDKRRSE